jgi:N-acetylglucosaminyldiphosphoundecaprenol N-acetyl-beta-D-mannosaminyltransferase
MATTNTRDRARVLGVDIDRLDMRQTVERCREMIESGRTAQHVSINVAKLVALHDDARLREIVEHCDIVSADGQPIVWASRLLGDPLPERVAGIDLFRELLMLADHAGYRLYLLGARNDVLKQAVQRITSEYPRVDIAGYHHGYFSDRESSEVANGVRASHPHMLFVAMNSPRKEYWLAEHGPALGVPLVMGIGGTLDVIAGVTRRAPRWAQNAGLEWLFRLAQEPRRLGRRYAATNIAFTRLVLAALVSNARVLFPAAPVNRATVRNRSSTRRK